MRNIEKILKKDNKLSVFKIKEYKEHIKEIKKMFSYYQLPFKCETDLDYFYYETVYQSILNKQTFETKYDETRNGMIDMWEFIDYNERNRFINDELMLIKAGLKRFYPNDSQVVWIPIFDELINALYDKEMVVFELPQFYKLYKKFAERFVERYHYGILPYKAGFSSCIALASSEEGFVLYNEKTMSFYLINSIKEYYIFPLNRIKAIKTLELKELNEISSILLRKDPKECIESLIHSNMLSNSIIKKLQKYQKSMK